MKKLLFIFLFIPTIIFGQKYNIKQNIVRNSILFSRGVTPINPNGFYNVLNYGAVGDGVHDDTEAIQNALNAATNSSVVFMPAGNYKITTALTIPSNTTLRGSGRNFGTTLTPTGCGAFVIDGTGVGGDWVFRIEISDMLVSLTNATATSAVHIKAAYNVILKNIFLYDQPVGVTNGIYVSGSNEITTDGVILYGNQTGIQKGYKVEGTPNPVNALNIINGNIENYDKGILTLNDVNINIFYPYMERCIVCLDYESTAGTCNIYGGTMTSVNGYVINVVGPNLNVYGTDLDPYQGAVRGGAAIVATVTDAYSNVNLYNIPRIANEGFIANTANLLTINTYPSPSLDTTNSATIYRKTLNFYKSVDDNVSTNLYKFQNLDLYFKCRLTLHGTLGTCYLEKIYDFMISESSSASTVNVTNILDTSGGNWIAVMTVALTPNVVGGYVMLSATVDTQGGLGDGLDFPLYGELEVVGAESGVGGIYLQ